MDFKNLSRWESILIVFCIFVFVFLSLVVIFRSEWLDSLIYGPEVDRQDVVTEPVIMEEPYATLTIDSVDGSALVFLSLEKGARITGLELELEKDPSLEIEDFICEEPFDCLFFEATDTEVSVATVIAPSLIDVFDGDLLVGEFIYSGTGSLFLDPSSTTFVSTTDNPDFNILDLGVAEFLLE